jgi:hypothetical protein
MTAAACVLGISNTKSKKMVAILGNNENEDGVIGTTAADDKSGVFGRANSKGWGVFGFSEKGFAGVFGSGGDNGVFGQTNNVGSNGVYGKNDSGGIGVFGQSLNGAGAGVLGRNEGSGWGLHGHAEGTGFAGVFGSGKNSGVFGLTQNGEASGVHGRNNGTNPKGAWGVFGFSEKGFAGVFGSGANNGVFGLTENGEASGVFGRNNGQNPTGAWGVFGFSEQGFAGVFGSSGSRNGVFGQTKSAIHSGVYGLCNGGGNGVAGISDSGTGVYAKGGQFAGFFEGNVSVTGSLFVKGTDISSLASQADSLGNLIRRVQGLEGRLQALEQENQLLKQEVAAIKNQSSGQSPSGKLPAGSSSPEISVMKKDGKFVVTGSGFLASRSISIRAVATNNPQDFRITSQNSESNGSLRLEWALSCNAGTPFTVTASDGRVISGNQLWSNPYQITC